MILYHADITSEPPDSTFVKAVPLVDTDNIFNIIDEHKGLTEDQRFPFLDSF